jgi:hypothetical protein
MTVNVNSALVRSHYVQLGLAVLCAGEASYYPLRPGRRLLTSFPSFESGARSISHRVRPVGFGHVL